MVSSYYLLMPSTWSNSFPYCVLSGVSLDLMPILRKPHSCWFGTHVLEHVVVSLTRSQACQCSLTLSRPFMEGVAKTEEDTHVVELRHRCGNAHGISVFFFKSVGKEK